MACTIVPAMWSRRQGNLAKRLIFGMSHEGELVALSALTDVVIRFRLRTQSRSTSVDGLGTISAYTDEDNDPPLYNAQYQWTDGDPDDPGVYVVEIDAVDGDDNPVTFPDNGDPWLIRIVGDVGGDMV